MADVEYRVQWRRVDWSPSSATKTRTFARERDARAFADRLGDHRRAGLSPAVVTVSHRPVGAWTRGWPQ
ncbi:hypothetical protein ACQEVZ_38710 [Dactylosporangium sp. CA-152071]|uniref:hypothetical protein n=1 Tax=Dactylosporangium sp. CA-152071 TaxID=3239933 RepID=UPI003D93726B